jgi:phosphoribosyl-AMP cyclohydrolase
MLAVVIASSSQRAREPRMIDRKTSHDNVFAPAASPAGPGSDVTGGAEPASPGQAPPAAAAALLGAVAFDSAGLVPAIAQQHDSGEILMLAWMNRESILETLATGRVCYWSRSRRQLWRKGETSGQVQRLVEMLVDCDGDALLLRVDQTGVACHTGRRSCFFRAPRQGRLETVAEPLIAPEQLYGG